MRTLISILLFLCITNFSYGQTFSQTFVDRCTGEVQIVSADFSSGSAIVSFYDEVRIFTYTEFKNGTLRSWLIQKYNWWQSLSPCSSVQQQTQTAQNAATNASNSATNASNAANTNTGATTSGGTSSSSSGGNSSSSGSSGSSSSGSSSSGSGSDSGGNGSSGGDSGGDSSGDSGNSSEGSNNNEGDNNNGESEGQGNSDGDEGSSEDSNTEGSGEDSSEDSSETDSEESGEGSEESDSEDSESDEVEEDSEEESKEEDKEEDKEKSEEDKEEEKKEKKKRKMMPIQLRADMMQQQALTLDYNSVLNIGASQTSIYGDRTYNLNGMLWDNLKQYGLSFSTSKVSLNSDYTVSWIDGVSFGYMRNYSMNSISASLNRMRPMGKWGTVGLGINYAYMFGKDTFGDKMPKMYSFGYNLLYTNSFKITDKIIYSPALIFAQNPLSVQQDDDWRNSATTNNDVMGILSNSFTVQFTRRFSLNIGWTLIGSSNEFVPIMNSFMVGSKIPF